MLLFIKMKIQYVYELFVKKNKYSELNINKLPINVYFKYLNSLIHK